MKRVLQVVDAMAYGGIQAFIMNIYRNIDRNQMQFDFAITRKLKNGYDEEIEKMGGNFYYFEKRRKNL